MSRDARGRFATGGRPHNRARHIYVEEVELLLGTDSPENIARRLGLKPASLARALEREGRGDLAREFLSTRSQSCVDCDTPVARGSERCPQCALDERWGRSRPGKRRAA